MPRGESLESISMCIPLKSWINTLGRKGDSTNSANLWCRVCTERRSSFPRNASKSTKSSAENVFKYELKKRERRTFLLWWDHRHAVLTLCTLSIWIREFARFLDAPIRFFFYFYDDLCEFNPILIKVYSCSILVLNFLWNPHTFLIL